MKALVALILSRLPEPVRVPVATGFSAVALGLLCLTALQVPTVESMRLQRAIDYLEIIVAVAMTIGTIVAIGNAIVLLLRWNYRHWRDGGE